MKQLLKGPRSSLEQARNNNRFSCINGSRADKPRAVGGKSGKALRSIPVLASYNTLPNAYNCANRRPLQTAKPQRPDLFRCHARTGHQSNIRQLGPAVYINDTEGLMS